MAIPITDPYRRVQPNVLGAIEIGLTQQLSREKMLIDDARARQVAAQKERDDERRHQQMMAQYGLNEMKFNYDVQQNVNKAEQEAAKSRLDQTRRDEDMDLRRKYYQLARERLDKPAASQKPRVVALNAQQIKENEIARTMGQPPPHSPTVIYPPAAEAGTYGDPYSGADVNNPDDPALVDLQKSLEAGMNGEPMPGEGSYGYGPPAYDASSDLPTGSGANSIDLLDPSITPPLNPVAAVPSSTLAQPAAKAPVAGGQGPLPMDPISIQKRQAMEYQRIKDEAEVLKATKEKITSAQEILDDKASSPEAKKTAEAIKKAAEREMAAVFPSEIKKGEVVPEDSITTTADNSMANQPAARSLRVNPATGFLAADQQQQESSPTPQTVMELADVYRKGTAAANMDSPANQQWTSAKQSLLQTIGGRDGLARELAAMKPPEDLAQMKARIRSILEKRRNPTDDLRGMGFLPDQNTIDIGPLPPDASVDDVADGLAEDLWKEPGTSAPAKNQGVTITRIK